MQTIITCMFNHQEPGITNLTLSVFEVEGGKADFQKFPKGGSPRRQVFEILG